MVGNIIRIVTGLAGLIVAGVLAVRTARARKAARAGESVDDRPTSFVPVYAVLVATALVMIVTVPLS